MTAYLSEYLIHVYLGFMLIAAGGLLWAIRRLESRARISRGNRE
jgi:hypothetical protein